MDLYDFLNFFLVTSLSQLQGLADPARLGTGERRRDLHSREPTPIFSSIPLKVNLRRYSD